jgi:hypothetical protein
MRRRLVIARVLCALARILQDSWHDGMRRRKAMYRKLFLILALAMGVIVIACQPEDSSDKAANHLEQAGPTARTAPRTLSIADQEFT